MRESLHEEVKKKSFGITIESGRRERADIEETTKE